MTQLANTISALVPSQLPEYIRGNYPNFQQLLVSYFQWMEDSNTGNAVYQIRNLSNYNHLDQTPDSFLQYFQNNFLPNFPQEISLDLRKLLKVATKFYQTKGSQNSLEFFFRTVYNLEAQVYYPAKNILKTSSGKWQLPQSIKLLLSPNNQSFDINTLQGRFGTGTVSNTTFVIESVNEYIDATIGKQVIELFLSNIQGQFVPGENIQINAGTYTNGTPIIFNEGIISALSGITINPNHQGLKYKGTTYYANGTINYPGDPVSIIGGINPLDGIEAVAFVQNVSQGSIQSVSVLNGGYGFQLNPNTIVTVIDAPGDTGVGANVIVNGVDTTNQVYLILNTDSIEYKGNVTLGSTNYGFANLANANINSVIGQALSYINIAVAPLTSLYTEYGGSGYTQVPSLSLLSVFNTDWSGDLWAAYQSDPTTNNYNNWIDTVQCVNDEGSIAAVVILNGGKYYSNTTDAIVVDSEIGMGATFDFITDANGSITQVLVINGGEGYSVTMPNLLVVNSNNYSVNSNGTGAILQAYGYSSGENLSITVSSIGKVKTIRMENRGFDYISTPIISLRNEDVTINPLANNQFYYQGDVVYQGANQNSASFIAYVDQYDRSNSILRLYNYIGSINIATDLISANFNSTPISVTIYGNGRAQANAQFYGGLIKYPGFWLGSSGFLSADQYLEGPIKYHDYSYLVKVEQDLAAYQQSIKNILHPAGMALLAIDTNTDVYPVSEKVESKPIQLANTSNTPGTITINAFGNGILTGTNTTFVGNVNVGDLFVISYNTSRIQTKIVEQVINNTVLILESNTEYFGPDRLSVNVDSNVVISDSLTSNLLPNDTIQTPLNKNIIISSADYLLVTINGLVQVPNVNYTVSNNILTFASNCSGGDLIETRIFGTDDTIISYNNVSTTNQNSFILPVNVNTVYAIVSINGLIQVPNVNYSININNLIFTSNCSNGDLIEARIFETDDIILNYSNVSSVNQNSFIIPFSMNSNSDSVVSKNGLLQIPDLQYFINGNNLIFTSNCSNGDLISIDYFNLSNDANDIIISRSEISSTNQSIFIINNTAYILVESVSGNVITVNTTFTSTESNVPYIAWPSMNNVSYEILRG